MSNRLAMPALDKVEKKFSVRVEGKTLEEYVSSFFENRVEPNQSH